MSLSLSTTRSPLSTLMVTTFPWWPSMTWGRMSHSYISRAETRYLFDWPSRACQDPLSVGGCRPLCVSYVKPDLRIPDVPLYRWGAVAGKRGRERVRAAGLGRRGPRRK